MPINLTAPVSLQERDALITFYNALDGDNWTDNTNWLSSEPVGNWSFVKTRGNKVVAINIFGNANLNGELPTEIGDLIHLEVLSIGIETGLTGPIPSSIGNLTQLQRFRFQLTSNSGSIPTSIGNLVNLWEIRILATNLSGELPSSLGDLTNIEQLYIPGTVFGGISNNFTGQIPTSIGNLTNLWTLRLDDNSFEGEIPSLSNLTELTELGLSNNDLSGPLPDLTNFTNSPDLITIILENNFFDFSDLEPLVNNGITYGFLSYSPQRTQDLEEIIDSAPDADITLNINDTGIGRPSNATSAMNNIYQWYKDDAQITGVNASSYTIFNAQPTDSGVYFCEITNPLLPDLIIRRATITLNVGVLNMDDYNLKQDLKIYPNPTKGLLEIKASNISSTFDVAVYTVLGKRVLSKTMSEANSQLNIEHLQSGVYLIKIETEKGSYTKKVIKN